MNARDILFYGDGTLMASLERIPPADRTKRGVVGWWSARETMAHLAIFEEQLVEVLELFIKGSGVPEAAQMSPEMNDVLVAQRKDETFDELFADYQKAHARVMELIEKIPPEKLREVGTIPWYGDQYSLDDFLVYTFYGHKREHAGRFEMFGDRLEGTDQ
ncbi:MAG TPA: DinB family protein [Anaerolineae bacterium]|nr:DinB family protein [Anaerolineae bacterium]